MHGKFTIMAWKIIYGVSQVSVLGPLLFTLYTADIGSFIHSFGLNHYTYADDNQVYSSYLPAECMILKDKISNCIDAIGKWMTRNQLMLNLTKSEFMWCSTPRRVHLINRSAFQVKDGTIEISSVIRNLKTFLNESMLVFSTNIDGNRVNQLIRYLAS